jgi:hypothetical protein
MPGFPVPLQHGSLFNAIFFHQDIFEILCVASEINQYIIIKQTFDLMKAACRKIRAANMCKRQ